MSFFEGLEADLRTGGKPFLLRAALWLLGLWERLRLRLSGR